MRRNRKLAKSLLLAFDIFLYLAVVQCNFRDTRCSFFRNAGIAVIDEDIDVEYEELDSI